ncbi:hypothetical protein AGMMS49921_12770 [Endomicrobiia bacterium]|nr:hypothetical protein AGMMS49921_12770 [Endomicrobiia bacterium]
MGVKKAFDKRAKDSKERRKEKIGQAASKEKIEYRKDSNDDVEYFRAIPKHIIT